MLCGRLTLMRYFIFFLTTQTCSWALHAEKLQDKYLPGLSHQPRHLLLPPGLFSLQPGHAPCHPLKTFFSLGIFTSSSSFSCGHCWGISPVWAPLGTTAAAMGGLGQHLRVGAASGLRILPAAQCHRTDIALGPFLPSPRRVSMSCFHFQWLGILGVDKGGLQCFRSNLFLSIQSLVSLLLVLWNKVLFKQKRRKKNYERILLNPR